MSRGVRGSARCGTPAGYRAHRRRNEDACDSCKKAWRGRQAEIRENPAVRESRLRYARAHNRAVAELKRRHRAEFRILLDRELQREDTA